MLRRAVELGVNHIDTAQYYGPDVSNELIHAALHPYADDLVLVSKVGGDRDDKGGWVPAQRPDQLRAGVEANLASLEVERVDVVNLRLMDENELGSAAEQVAFDDQLAEMVALRDEGKIGAIGLSNVSTDQVRHALDGTQIACVQNAYNLLTRGDEPTLALCAKRGLAYVPSSRWVRRSAGCPGPPTTRSCRTLRRRPVRRPCRLGSPGCWPTTPRYCYPRHREPRAPRGESGHREGGAHGGADDPLGVRAGITGRVTRPPCVAVS